MQQPAGILFEMKSFSPQRWMWFLAGIVCVITGFIGIILPLLPTTIFMILAAFCFARSSRRMNNWLLNHPHFGEQIIHWQNHKAISTKGKKTATIAMAIILAISYILGFAAHIILIQAAIFTLVLAYLWSRPSPPAV